MDWFASDLHFCHAKVVEFRPFATVEEHDEAVIANWNALVRPKDCCLLLGDVAFNVGLPLLARLNGRKWLVMGNHEHKNISEYLPYFEDIKSCRVDGKRGIVYTHIPVHPSQLDRWAVNVHGHLHAANIDDPRYVNISLEQIDYRPIHRDKLFLKCNV
jgi:calcineurin-like phosphoesterase family protein